MQGVDKEGEKDTCRPARSIPPASGGYGRVEVSESGKGSSPGPVCLTVCALNWMCHHLAPCIFFFPPPLASFFKGRFLYLRESGLHSGIYSRESKCGASCFQSPVLCPLHHLPEHGFADLFSLCELFDEPLKTAFTSVVFSFILSVFSLMLPT